MTLFQWIALLFLGTLLLWECVNLWRGPMSKGFWFVRSLVWVGAAVTIADPGLMQDLAAAIGIGRGTDVVLYFFVLAFLGTSFYLYARQVQMQRRVTLLVRHIALHEARRGPLGNPSDNE
jgi:hypothetical protein